MKHWSWLIFLLWLMLNAFAQTPLLSPVVDKAELLNAGQREKLEAMLREHEKKTTNQVVVVSVTSLEGQSIEEFGYKLGRAWAIGQKEKNNGVLFIIAPNEREVRIEVGYGLEGELTDAKSKIIIERIILPYFKKGQMAEGVLEGTMAIIGSLENNELVTTKDETGYEVLNIFFIVGIFILLVFLSNRGSGRGGPRFPSSRGPFYSGYRGSKSHGGFRGGGGSFGGGGSSGRW